MKENQQCGKCCPQVCCYCTDELPPCLPRPAKLKKEPLYLEEWNPRRSRILDAALNEIERRGKAGCKVMKNARSKFYQLFASEWERLNPCPPLNRNEFINQLHNRLSALEAQMLQKGGLL